MVNKEKKKVALFTIQSINIGNRLQNYATQYVLEELGYRVESLRTKKASLIDNVFFALRIIKNKRIRNYFRFQKLIHYSRYYITTTSLSVFNRSNYYAIVVGSDQVWNTNFKKIVSINSFLPFPYRKKISYASSFGTTSIPYDDEIARCLRDFDCISVREETGVAIVQELSGKPAINLVDPTMMLNEVQWRKIERKPKIIKSGYILTYFLDKKCSDAKKTIESLKGSKDIIEIMNPSDKIAGDAGPAEFIWLIDHADLILTDSFHASVFSFLFGKPFVVYDRSIHSDMNSRLETLLSKFHLERKYAGSGLENDIWEHDYSEGYKQLEVERKKAMDFLKRNLE